MKRAFVLVSALLAGCECGSTTPSNDGGAIAGGMAAGGVVGGGATAGGSSVGGGAIAGGSAGGGASGVGGGNTLPDGGMCVAAGQPCVAGTSTCCANGTCLNGLCRAPSFCSQNGASCATGTECCSGRCSQNVCSATQCTATGTACTSPSECCTGLCNGVCQQVPGGTCKVVGDHCTTGADCCSTLCRGGVCQRAYSCQPNDDLCRSDSECCGLRCSATGDGGVGRCLYVTGMGGGACLQEGNPCSGGSNCCSRSCFDPGSGATVCLPAGGCRLTGTWCTNADQCCGGGVNPNGSVQCRSGRCDNGNSCNGVGNICGQAHLPDGGIKMINASMNCCGGDEACKLDLSGIPRCFGGPAIDAGACPSGFTGQAPCCIAPQGVCQFRDQCCNGNLCLPSDGGVLRCQGLTCTQAGGSCAGAADCCSGLSCILNACRPQALDAGVGGDAGTSDGGAPLCKGNGTACQFSAECCSMNCNQGTCGPAMVCQGLGGVCGSNVDCCAGTACTIPAGQQTGTCAPSTCVAQGQTCTAGGASCCAGLGCYDQTFSTCSGTGLCTCRFGIQ